MSASSSYWTILLSTTPVLLLNGLQPTHERWCNFSLPYSHFLSPTEEFFSACRWKVYDYGPHDQMSHLGRNDCRLSVHHCRGLPKAWMPHTGRFFFFPRCICEKKTPSVMLMKTWADRQRMDWMICVCVAFFSICFVFGVICWLGVFNCYSLCITYSISESVKYKMEKGEMKPFVSGCSCSWVTFSMLWSSLVKKNSFGKH